MPIFYPKNFSRDKFDKLIRKEKIFRALSKITSVLFPLTAASLAIYLAFYLAATPKLTKHVGFLALLMCFFMLGTFVFPKLLDKRADMYDKKAINMIYPGSDKR